MTNLKVKTTLEKSAHVDRDKLIARELLNTLVNLIGSAPIAYEDVFAVIKKERVSDIEIEL